MARRVIWSKSALADVDSIADYISRDSKAYAATVVRKILDSVRHLMRFPNSGRQVPELQDAAIRELFVYSYRIIYRVSQTEVLIVARFTAKEILDDLQ